jgi:hypothetical protein
LESTSRLIDELANRNEYQLLAHKWKHGTIKVIHDDVETFTDDFTTIHMSFSNRLERNALMYVMVHELTHIHLQSVAHDARFVAELEKLHAIAIRLGVCEPIDGSDLYRNKTIDSY